MPLASSRVPSSGSTATSTSGPWPLPTRSPLNSIGASSFSPSPITTIPSISTVSSISRIASTAAWSAASLSPRPTKRPAAIAAASVTRTSSSARFRSGGVATAESYGLHPLGSLDRDQVERLRDHVLRRPTEAEPERLRLAALEHAVVVVEAVEVVGELDRVGREGVRAAPLRRRLDDAGEVDDPFDQVPLLLRELAGRLGGDERRTRVAHDPGNPRVRVLHVEDGVLLRLLRGEVDVDLDRLVGAAADEVPAGGVDADLVDELVEEDHVAPTLRHLRLPPAAGQVDELVEEHLDALRVEAEHARDRRVPVPRSVVVGAEDVDRPLEASFELVLEVRDVGGAVRRPTALLR